VPRSPTGWAGHTDFNDECHRTIRRGDSVGICGRVIVVVQAHVTPPVAAARRVRSLRALLGLRETDGRSSGTPDPPIGHRGVPYARDTDGVVPARGFAYSWAPYLSPCGSEPGPRRARSLSASLRCCPCDALREAHDRATDQLAPREILRDRCCLDHRELPRPEPHLDADRAAQVGRHANPQKQKAGSALFVELCRQTRGFRARLIGRRLRRGGSHHQLQIRNQWGLGHASAVIPSPPQSHAQRRTRGQLCRTALAR